MLTFLFWNINKNPIQEIIGDIVEMHSVDFVILAECRIDKINMIRALNRSRSFDLARTYKPDSKISIYVNSCKNWLHPLEDTRDFSFNHLVNPRGDKKILVAAAHLPSKANKKDEDIRFTAEKSIKIIENQENFVGHKRTIVVGDLNMNPFDEGMVSFTGFHGVMDKKVALKGGRVFDGERRNFFYNPMWSLLGDGICSPSGTFYYNKGSKNYFWHMLDQILLRPDLIPFFPNDELRIITETDSHSLLSASGLPNSNLASDHLPLLFKINF